VIPVILTVLLALGMYLIYDGLTSPRRLEIGAWLDERRDGLERRIGEFLAGAGLPDVAIHQFVLASLLAGLVVAASSQAILGWPLVSGVGFGFGLILPFSYYARRRDRRRALIQAEMADAIDQLTASVRAGLSIAEALGGLAAHGPAGMKPEWATLVREQRLLGLGPALVAMRERLADPTVDVVTLALALAEQTGGRNVTTTLDQLSATVRARVRLQEAVRAEQARHRLTAQIIAGLPLILLLLVRAINPEYLAVYDTLLGQLIIGVAVLMDGVGYALMLWLGRLPGEPRLLRSGG
jgi:tight adherence protein B